MTGITLHGHDWLGEIPADWTLTKIDTLYTPRKTKVSDRDFEPLSVTMQGVVPQLDNAAKTDAHDDRKLVRKGDFVINSRSDRRGSCGIADRDGSVSLINTVLIPKKQMNPRFYDWLFHTSAFADEFYKNGHGIVDDLWSTNWQGMRDILIVSPPLAEQELIARFLDKAVPAIDEAVSLVARQIKALEAYKRSVIHEAVTKGTRGVSETWSINKLKHCTYIRARLGWKGLTADEYVDDGYPMYSAFNFVNDKLVFSPVNFISEQRYLESPEIMLQLGDVLLVKDGAGVGQCACVTELPREATVNGSIAVITPDSTLNSKYLYYVFCSTRFKDASQLVITGMGVPHLTQHFMRNIEIPVPCLSEQGEIVEYLDSKCAVIDKSLALKREQFENLRKQRQSLIYEYVTGKRRVS